jgi:hypothetical protein
MHPMPGMLSLMGPGSMSFTDPLLSGDPLSASDVTGLKTAIDTFASSYTSGADASKDQAAVSALEKSLWSLASSHWKVPPPQPVASPLIDGSQPAVSPVAAPTTTPTTAPGIAHAMLMTTAQGGTAVAALGPNGQPTGMA